jgi:predicted amidohydrolase
MERKHSMSQVAAPGNGCVRVAVGQLNSVLGDVAANWERAAELVPEAARQGAQIVVFPECYLQGYRADDRFAETAVPLDGPFARRVTSIAHELGIWIVLGLARTDSGFPHLVYNSGALFGPDGLVGCYDKVHLGTFLKYREGVYFARGQHIPVFDLPFARIGIQICYDAMFPEVGRVLALKGAEINVVMSAGPDEFRATWGPLLQVRSNENTYWTVYANTVGDQLDDHFFGGSRIVGPDGSVREQGPEDIEACVVADLNLEEARLLRRQTLRFRERVPQLYAPLIE